MDAIAETARVWLVGGTSESAELARVIVQAGLCGVVTVTTEAARSLYPDTAQLQVWVGRLNRQALSQFVQEHQIATILDASHPFAVEISERAIAVAQEFQIPYLRYERPTVDAATREDIQPYAPTEIYLENFDALIQGGVLTGQRVLLTVGYRPLHLFQSWQNRATLFARILPSSTALEAALAAGFTPDRLLAIRPPVSAEMERALWQQWQISVVVTKASGALGGEEVKRQVAKELGTVLVVIDRPNVAYPQQTNNILTALEFCQNATCRRATL